MDASVQKGMDFLFFLGHGHVEKKAVTYSAQAKLRAWAMASGSATVTWMSWANEALSVRTSRSNTSLQEGPLF